MAAPTEAARSMKRTKALSPLIDAAKTAASWLSAANVPAAIVGGFAIAVRARPRMTKDIDFVALSELDRIPNLIERGVDLGLQPRRKDAVPFANSTRVLL